jgi:hypothetical protein
MPTMMRVPTSSTMVKPLQFFITGLILGDAKLGIEMDRR